MQVAPRTGREESAPRWPDYPVAMPHPPRARGRQVNAFQALALLLSFVLVAGVSGVLAAGLVLPGVAVADEVTDLTVTAFDDLPTELEPTQLPEKSVILAADGTLLATFFSEDRVVVPLSEISVHLQHAVVAIEDKRFYQHAGVDPPGMLRAAVKGALGSSDEGQQGASTLTQQYVKNVLIQAAATKETEAERLAAMQAATEADGAEGYARKLREAKLAIALEKQMTKDEILEKYLNIAQFGIKVYGAEAAAQYYFGIPAKDLNYLQAATIAGVTQSPTHWDPVRDPVVSKERRDTVLLTMHEQGYITDDEFQAGLATPVEATLNPHPLRVGCVAASDAVPGSGYFCDFVTKVIVNDETFGADAATRKALLYNGGLTITTTLDPGKQAIADAEVKAAVPVDDSSRLGHALVSVEPGTGKIIAMAQNRIYAPVAANPGEEPINFNTDFAYGASGGFAPGSTYKPFTLLAWLQAGHSLYEVVNGAKRPLNENMFRICGAKAGNAPYTPNNSEGNGSMMTVLDATRNSVNLAYLSMAMELDMCNIGDAAESIGVHRAKGRERDDGTIDRLLKGSTRFGVNPSNVLGTDVVAPLTMASAFAAFASGGMYCNPIAITSVTDTNGNPIEVPDAGCHQAIEARVANTMNFALSGVWQGTADGVGAPPFPSAGKTGTTSENEQTWFVGYTPRLATAVWLGDPKESRRQVKRMYVGGKWVNRAFGATVSAPTWKRFMVQALAGGDNPGFAAPDDKLVYGEKVNVPNVVGRTEGDARAILEQRGFKVRVDGAQVPSNVPAGSVAEQSPSGQATKGGTITLKLSNGQGGGQQPPGPGGPGGFPGGGGGGPGNNNGRGQP